EPRHVAVEQCGADAAGEQREAIPVLPGVDVVGPAAGAGDAEGGEGEVAAAEREGAVHGQEGAHAAGGDLAHLLGGVAAGQPAHGGDGGGEVLAPGGGYFGGGGGGRGPRGGPPAGGAGGGARGGGLFWGGGGGTGARGGRGPTGGPSRRPASGPAVSLSARALYRECANGPTGHPPAGAALVVRPGRAAPGRRSLLRG